MNSKKTKAVAPSKESTASQDNQPAQFNLPLWPESTPKRTKQGTILDLLGKRSLNRFEAERFGDHCLHSTVSTLKNQGHVIVNVWETVNTRFKPTRVKRYSLVRRAA
jgi:hypothetical protein